MNLKDNKEWDKINGTLSVSQEPDKDADTRFVVLNGNTGNFCLDFSVEEEDKGKAMERAWSSDTSYYVKILPNNIRLTRWWDGHQEDVANSVVENNPKLFYKALTKDISRPAGSIIAFAKETFLKLRNNIMLSDNGQVALRTFMYLLAALEKGVQTPKEVDSSYWNLKEFDSNWIRPDDWEILYTAFNKGTYITNGITIKPLVKLVLRHASNRLFQEAHREATRKDFQLAMFGEVSRKYDSGISEGAYYTPTPLVRTIVQEAIWALDKIKPLLQRTSIRILDPACGSAEFLREALRQLKIKKYNGKVNIVGWDISDIACEMAKFVLGYENHTEWNGKVIIEIEKKNSLTYDWNKEQPFDIVLMNPPFIPFEKLGELKTVVLEKLNGLINRQPDMAAVFWKNASEALKEEGVLGIILPHSLLSAETYSNLRKYIKEELKLNFSLLGKLGSAGLFEKAMIIPSIQIGTKEKSVGVKTVLWTNYQQKSAYEAFRDLRIYRINDIPTPINTPTYSIYENELLTDTENTNQDWSVKSFSIYQLTKKLVEFDTVQDLFRVQRGADAGNNQAFLLNKNTWLSLPKKEQKYFHPCTMRDSIKEGKLNDNWYLFFPYGKNKITSEVDLKDRLATFYKQKLLPNIDKLKKRKGKSELWWELSRPRLDWQLNGKPKLISAYFGRSGYFSIDPKGEFLVGQSFAWIPKNKKLEGAKYCYAYLGLLHAPIIDILLEMVCNVLDGGYYDLSKHYVNKMPLPDLTKIDGTILNLLVKTGKSIHEGKVIDKDDLNQVVANIYGLNIENMI